MGKCISNRNKFILNRLSFIIGVGLVVPFIITSFYLAANGSAIWWNVQAVSTNATISNVTIVSRKYIELCNSACTGDCAKCEVNYFNAYISATYLTYEYRYLLYNKMYHTLDYVEHGLKQYKVNNTIILYYNPSDPRDVSLNFRDSQGDIVCFGMVIFIFVLFSVLLIIVCRPRVPDVPKEDEDLEANKTDIGKPTVNKDNEYTAVSTDNIELEPLYLFNRSDKIIK